jgi:hypothetical protein
MTNSPTVSTAPKKPEKKGENSVPSLNVGRDEKGKKKKKDPSESWIEWLEKHGFKYPLDEDEEIKIKEGDIEFIITNSSLMMNGEITEENFEKLLEKAAMRGWTEVEFDIKKVPANQRQMYQDTMDAALKSFNDKRHKAGLQPIIMDGKTGLEKRDATGPDQSPGEIKEVTDNKEENHNDHSDLLARYEEFSSNTVETVFSKAERELVQAEIAAELNKENPNFMVENLSTPKI